MNDSDHRILGSNLDLFHQQHEGPGMVFWHPRGWALYRVLEDYVRMRMRRAGFREIRTPQLLARALWERSGHWDKFGSQMYALPERSMIEPSAGVDHDDALTLCLKPMSCPCHVQVFNQGLRSYRELPIRYSEFGACHRDEPSGSLEGLKRTRAFVQDDAHVFCTKSQIENEVVRFCALLRAVYADLGFSSVKVALATRPMQRAGDEAVWDQAEASLAAAARAAGLEFELSEGEGAFYGPKLEFKLSDSRGREWQCGTIQLDFVLPERLSAHFINAENVRETPVMVHHAVLGSMERFIAILLEHYDGWLPVWLAPEQIVVASISDTHAPYAMRVVQMLDSAGLRVVADCRAERLERKIMDARRLQIPLLIAVGARDERNGTVSIRNRNGDQVTLPLDEAITALLCEAKVPAP
ncbi:MULTISPECIES: threonine--tRNA ligase [Burkholderia cepacia complex]|uniref:threonine--tRNA ligase n=1 Tax=Burkholderia cepacia complex TaxID=87882 RepID=UPI000F086EEA|nr:MULTISPECIES: threonine--tRNA ligase [Burkholderia cepacia complex]AYQ43725.1 threonine--tRNA ligase [Burkholderia lata]